MAEKRRKTKKQQEEPQAPTKEEYAVASFLRFNVATREGKLGGLPVTCFYASKAVDILLDSKWANKKGKAEALFTTRQSCADYCNELLRKGLFHRGLRTDKKKDKDKKSKKTEIKEEKTEKSKKSKKKEEKEKENEEKGTDTEKEKDKESEKKVTKKKDEEKKKKKKMKIEMHDSQMFLDGEEVYVWIYDPTPFKNKVIGLLLVLGAIGVCLFPLWPPEVRLGVYYLSLAAASFVGFILVLCIIRLIVFSIVWGLTMGRHHFWLLPNLTEDVGFFDSFKPLYQHERCTDEQTKDESSTDKQENDNENNSNEDGSTDKNKSSEDTEKDISVESKNNKDESNLNDNEENEDSEDNNGTDHSDSNGYEVVSHQDLDKDLNVEN